MTAQTSTARARDLLAKAEAREKAAVAGLGDLFPSQPQSLVRKNHAETYSHSAMVDLMVNCPDYSHQQLCEHFGRPASWLASVLASEAFQQVLDLRRHEVLDPSLTATMQERFKALAIRTSDVLLEKLDNPNVDPFLLVRASEISIKAIGMGQKALEPTAVALPPSTNTLAERILAMMDKANGNNTLDGEVTDVTVRHGDV